VTTLGGFGGRRGLVTSISRLCCRAFVVTTFGGLGSDALCTVSRICKLAFQRRTAAGSQDTSQHQGNDAHFECLH